MLVRSPLVIAALTALGGAVLIAIVHARTTSESLGPVETITGVPFPRTENGIHITESLVHVRVPFSTSGIGKRLVLTLGYDMGTADVLEAGIRRGAFWLNVERIPIRHRVLDRLAHPDSGWTVVQDHDETVLLPPDAQPVPSLSEFRGQPPPDGVIGLYGNATLACGAPHAPEPRSHPVSGGRSSTGAGEDVRTSSREQALPPAKADADTPCATAAFKITEKPEEFRAILARYRPQPDNPDRGEATLAFPLDATFQQPDGAFDLMVFAQRADGGDVHVALTKIDARIESAMPPLDALALRARRVLRELVSRPSPQE